MSTGTDPMENTKTHQILIVDDEPDILSLLEEVLVRRKYVVHSADTIADALKIIEGNNDISLVISDIKMPEGTGVELLKKIRSRNPVKPAVVFLTAFTDISEEDIYDRGASGFIEKPIDIKSFTKTIENLLADVDNGYCPGDICEAAPCTHNINLKLESMKDARIGNGGIFIPTSNITVKTKELITFDIIFKSGETPIKGIGEVAWIRKDASKSPAGIGVKFSKLYKESEQALHEYAKKNTIIAFIPKG
jgi:CheY-like chemotaxis protein/Tfp pilus assembly protein PilZ